MSDLERNYSFLRAYVKGEAAIGFWNMIGKIVGAGNALILISHLEVFQYGTYILIIAFYSLLSGFISPILQGVILNDIGRFIGEGNEASAKRLYLETVCVRLCTALIIAIVVFWGADIVAQYYDEDIGLLLRIIAPLFIIDTIYNAMKLLFQVRLRFHTMSVRAVVYRIVRFVLLVAAVFFSTLTVTEALVIHVIATLIAMLVLVLPFRNVYREWKKVIATPQWLLPRIAMTYGKWQFFGQVSSQLTSNIRPWLIKFFINTEAVAVYSVAESLFGVVKSFIPTETLVSLLPREARNHERAGRLLLRGTKYLAIGSIAVALVAGVVVPPIAVLLFPKYAASMPLFQILLISLPILSFRAMATNFLTLFREQKFLFVSLMIKVAANIILPVSLLYLFGISGMAIERSATALLLAFIMYGYLVRHNLDASLPWARILFHFDNEDKQFLQNLYRRSASYARRKIYNTMRLFSSQP